MPSAPMVATTTDRLAFMATATTVVASMARPAVAADSMVAVTPVVDSMVVVTPVADSTVAAVTVGMAEATAVIARPLKQADQAAEPFGLRRFVYASSTLHWYFAWYSESVLNLRTLSTACLFPTLLLVLSGCHGHTVSLSGPQARAERSAELETEREQLDQIPPPTKSTFMTVHNFDSWQNPVLTVQPSMVELHVLLADANTTPIGVGGMFRPVNARRQELNVSMSSLGDAMSAIPHSSWPYGRVVAIEEANKTPASAEPAVRRNMEITISKLNDLGIVVYDLGSGKIQ
jgi:hypothetical protein